MKRNTVQRRIILETLQKFDTHPTVEEIYQEIHKDQGRYDRRANRHNHFKCKNCGILIAELIIGFEKLKERMITCERFT